MARFVGADTRTNTVIFGKNTTEAINKLAFRYPLPPGSVVLSTEMEHHSNDLPWRRATVVRARVTPDGRLDEDDVDRLLALVRRAHRARHRQRRLQRHRLHPAHPSSGSEGASRGASILVDAAQLAPHRRIDVKPDDDPEHIDFVALSAHKMYAPFGTGALVGRRDIFLQRRTGVPGRRHGRDRDTGRSSLGRAPGSRGSGESQCHRSHRDGRSGPDADGRWEGELERHEAC